MWFHQYITSFVIFYHPKESLQIARKAAKSGTFLIFFEGPLYEDGGNLLIRFRVSFSLQNVTQTHKLLGCSHNMF